MKLTTYLKSSWIFLNLEMLFPINFFDCFVLIWGHIDCFVLIWGHMVYFGIGFVLMTTSGKIYN